MAWFMSNDNVAHKHSEKLKQWYTWLSLFSTKSRIASSAAPLAKIPPLSYQQKLQDTNTSELYRPKLDKLVLFYYLIQTLSERIIIVILLSIRKKERKKRKEKRFCFQLKRKKEMAKENNKWLNPQNFVKMINLSVI